MKPSKDTRLNFNFATRRLKAQAIKRADEEGRNLTQHLNELIKMDVKKLTKAVVIVAAMLLTSCASTYDLSEVRGHYTPQDTTEACPSSVDIYAANNTASITVTDKDLHQSTVNYFVAPNGQLIRANVSAPATYLMSVGHRTLMLTTIEGKEFKYNLTK